MRKIEKKKRKNKNSIRGIGKKIERQLFEQTKVKWKRKSANFHLPLLGVLTHFKNKILEN